MFYVYAKDRMHDDYLNCITMEECKAEPWRWEYVQVSPGQEHEPEVIAFLKGEKVEAPKEEEKYEVLNDLTETPKTKGRPVKK